MKRILIKRNEFESATVKAGFSVAKLAQLAGVSRQNLYSAIRGKSGLSPRTASNVLGILKKDLKDFDLLFEITDK